MQCLLIPHHRHHLNIVAKRLSCVVAQIAAIIYAKKHNAGVVVVSDAAYLAGLGAGRYEAVNIFVL